MRFLYSLYGLTLQADRPLPGLLAAPAGLAPDVRVWFTAPADLREWAWGEEELWYTSPVADESHEPALKVWKAAGRDCVRMLYSDGTEFIVARPGTEIRAAWPREATLEDTATYLLGPVLGYVLRLRGVTCLHASAVAVADQAIAFLGPRGSGKSTTAAAFATLGYPVLSDDVVALREEGDGLAVQPGYAHLRLWPDAVRCLYGSPDVLPRLTPADGASAWWDKRGLDLLGSSYQFQRHPLPLAAVYLLGDSSPGEEFSIVGCPPSHPTLMALVANTYVNYLLDSAMRSRELPLLGRLINRVPLRQVTNPRNLGLSRLCELVLEDFRSLTGAVPTP
jgi:hypothetical protein